MTAENYGDRASKIAQRAQKLRAQVPAIIRAHPMTAEALNLLDAAEELINDLITEVQGGSEFDD